MLLDLEKLDDTNVAAIKDCYKAIAKKSREALKRGENDIGTPFVHIEMA